MDKSTVVVKCPMFLKIKGKPYRLKVGKTLPKAVQNFWSDSVFTNFVEQGFLAEADSVVNEETTSTTIEEETEAVEE